MVDGQRDIMFLALKMEEAMSQESRQDLKGENKARKWSLSCSLQKEHNLCFSP